MKFKMTNFGVEKYKGRTLYGVRGLKSKSGALLINGTRSHSVWSAWIEILSAVFLASVNCCRTLYGVRGLKFTLFNPLTYRYVSHSVWSAWIEI